jgi:Protein of unknown function (DUF4232)
VVSRVKLIIGVAAAAAAFAATTGSGAAAPAACRPSQLHAKLAVVRGSAGAGNISYRLLLRNGSRSSCTVSGHPGLRLRGAAGRRLPTHLTAVPPGAGTAALITLPPGGSAAATLRFSPDVPGKGEQATGRCEPVAHSVRVTLASPGSGSLVGPIKPPTSVCEHGSMTEGLLSKV